MIVDCDSHFMPKEAFDHVDDPKRPTLKFNEEGLLVDIDAPGVPRLPATTPRSPPGSGAH